MIESSCANASNRGRRRERERKKKKERTTRWLTFFFVHIYTHTQYYSTRENESLHNTVVDSGSSIDRAKKKIHRLCVDTIGMDMKHVLCLLVACLLISGKFHLDSWTTTGRAFGSFASRARRSP